jgi:peptidoglycan/xylan/chitin deacetylase (PgdA/CDA1 family)
MKRILVPVVILLVLVLLALGFYAFNNTQTGVPVLMYHHLVPEDLNQEPGNESIITVEAFEAQMKYLYDEGYYTPTLAELEQYVAGETELPDKSIVLTFDDGYESNFVYAYSILKAYGFKGAIFPIGKSIATEIVPYDPSNFKKLPHLALAEMEATTDIFEYHSHTYDLHRKVEDSFGKKQPVVKQEPLLVQADIDQMKAAGIDTPYLSYPFGVRTDELVQTLQDNGYRMAFTIDQKGAFFGLFGAKKIVKPGMDPMALPRITVTTKTDMAQLLKNYK